MFSTNAVDKSVDETAQKPGNPYNIGFLIKLAIF